MVFKPYLLLEWRILLLPASGTRGHFNAQFQVYKALSQDIFANSRPATKSGFLHNGAAGFYKPRFR
jgi:hypothetical protein